MFKVLQTYTNAYRCSLGFSQASLWRLGGLAFPALGCRSMAEKNASSDDENFMAPEGRKNKLIKRPSAFPEVQTRAHLDVFNYLPLSDHFMMMSTGMTIRLGSEEYKVLSISRKIENSSKLK